jgi:hypothetical protein
LSASCSMFCNQGIEAPYLPDERLDAAGTTVDLVESDLTDNSATVFPGGDGVSG